MSDDSAQMTRKGLLRKAGMLALLAPAAMLAACAQEPPPPPAPAPAPRRARG